LSRVENPNVSLFLVVIVWKSRKRLKDIVPIKERFFCEARDRQESGVLELSSYFIVTLIYSCFLIL
jgi:hypothetical protein